jgi:hypothetical protein
MKQTMMMMMMMIAVIALTTVRADPQAPVLPPAFEMSASLAYMSEEVTYTAALQAWMDYGLQKEKVVLHSPSPDMPDFVQIIDYAQGLFTMVTDFHGEQYCQQFSMSMPMPPRDVIGSYCSYTGPGIVDGHAVDQWHCPAFDVAGAKVSSDIFTTSSSVVAQSIVIDGLPEASEWMSMQEVQAFPKIPVAVFDVPAICTSDDATAPMKRSIAAGDVPMRHRFALAPIVDQLWHQAAQKK